MQCLCVWFKTAWLLKLEADFRLKWSLSLEGSYQQHDAYYWSSFHILFLSFLKFIRQFLPSVVVNLVASSSLIMYETGEDKERSKHYVNKTLPLQSCYDRCFIFYIFDNNPYYAKTFWHNFSVFVSQITILCVILISINCLLQIGNLDRFYFLKEWGKKINI